MITLIAVGILVSIVVELLKTKKRANKVENIARLLALSGVIAFANSLVSDTSFLSGFFWIMIFAGAFYAYILRNVRK